MKCMMLFKGGKAAPEEQEAEMGLWMKWINDMGERFVDGAPFNPAAKKVMGPDVTVEDFESGDDGIAGYCVVSVDSLQAAADLAKGCPNLPRGGKVKVYEMMEM